MPTTVFGPGLSWWFPERATAFLLEHKLPGQVFHDFSVGGYLTWRIGEQYPDFADGRVIPFADGAIDEQKRIASLPPDSAELQKAADRWNLQTMLFSVARFNGLGSFPLPQYCESQNWKSVYFDDVSVIFLRNTPENADLIAKFGQDCRRVRLTAWPQSRGDSFSSKAERFNFLMNASSIYFLLERDTEAWSGLGEAEKLFPQVASLHLLKAQLWAAENHPKEAETEYLETLRLDPCDECWYALARLYVSERQYPQAEQALQQAAKMSLEPYERVRSLGQLYLLMDRPQAALAEFARAEAVSPFHGEARSQGRGFRAQLAEGRAHAYLQLHEAPRAVEEENAALQLDPDNPRRWRFLADLYQGQGQTQKAVEAREKAERIEKQAGSWTSAAGTSQNK